MAIERVRAYFEALGRGKDLLEFESSSATVELAARAVGVIPARIAKTLSFSLDKGCVLVVAAGDARVDNRKFKETFGKKAKMLTPQEVLELTGHAVGGVCPFALAQPGRVRICLDASLRRFKTVFPACGSSNSAIELSCAELEQYTENPQWVDVCKDWDPELG